MNKTTMRRTVMMLLVCFCVAPVIGAGEADFQHGRLASIAVDGQPLPGFDPELNIAMYGTTVPNETSTITLDFEATPGTLGTPLVQAECAVSHNDGEPLEQFEPAEDGALRFTGSFPLVVGENKFVIRLAGEGGASEYTLFVMRKDPPKETVESRTPIATRTLPPWATPHPESTYERAVVGNTSGSASVYSGPGRENTVVGSVSAEEEIFLSRWSDDGAWCEVFYHDSGNIGWLEGRYIILWAE